MAALLVVDDNPLVLSVTTRILEAAGHFIVSAIGGALGIAAFELHASRIHAVLMDVVMPEVDGVMAFGQIRRRRPDVPFVFVTGNAEMVPDAILVEPRVALLTKPYDVEDLIATVDQVLAPVPESLRPPWRERTKFGRVARPVPPPAAGKFRPRR